MENLKEIKRVFAAELNALAVVRDNLGQDIDSVISELSSAKGKIVLSGVGKSGLIARKIAATMSSTGTAAIFVHSTEALHGDFGILDDCDKVVLLSYSGETREVLALLRPLLAKSICVIAITGNAESTLATAATYHLNIKVPSEACPLNLAPTSSTTAMLVLGDAIAACLMKIKKFSSDKFAVSHPAGALGRRLLTRVKHEMIYDNSSLVDTDASFSEIVGHMTTGILGVVVVKSADTYGIITDGDLRRAIDKYGKKVFDMRADNIMTFNPHMIDENELVHDALELMKVEKIHALVVLKNGTYSGIFKR